MQVLLHGTTATPATIPVPPPLAPPVIETGFGRRLHPYGPELREKTRTRLLEERLMPADEVEERADGLYGH
ncbi:hypothetical protein [Streptomyces glaucus]|uniref:hypothetical protein n=1 Tax=Streptomyces glaucus TaxID=284029 RepID=UPI003CD080F4